LCHSIKREKESFKPLLTLRPRLLFSFKGSTILRCFWGKGREFISGFLDGTENLSAQSLRNSSLSNNSPCPFSSGSAAQKETKHKTNMNPSNDL